MNSALLAIVVLVAVVGQACALAEGHEPDDVATVGFLRSVRSPTTGQSARLLLSAGTSDVPVEDPRHFEVVLDAGVARRLGVEFPADLIREADEVRGGAG